MSEMQALHRFHLRIQLMYSSSWLAGIELRSAHHDHMCDQQAPSSDLSDDSSTRAVPRIVEAASHFIFCQDDTSIRLVMSEIPSLA